MKYRWKTAEEQPLLTRALVADVRVSPLAAQCLVNRGFSEADQARSFLEPRLKNLRDPFLLPQMDLAVARLLLALERREPLVIFGDYDVDGVTATALLTTVLQPLGWVVRQFVPDRFGEGYGLTQAAVENCLEQHPATLLLAVDCGSTSVEQVAWLRERGVDVLVLDHHQFGPVLPAANALVNPQLGEEFRELCSVGLAFKLAHALLKQGREAGLPGFDRFELKPLLDLVALGTVADLVPLTGENRILVSVGLERLSSTTRPGLVALKEVAGVTGPCAPYSVGFQLGPRLNAAGRIETARAALDLLLAPDLETARPLAEALDQTNRERQNIERRMADDVVGIVRSKFNPEQDVVIVEGAPLWHIGVVGIVASRVLREFYRPTLIIGGDGPYWRGSGRSVTGFDLAAALRECGDLLVKHGGHAMAAGVTLEPGNLPALRERLNTLARRALTAEQLVPELRLDAAVALAELTEASLAELARLEPFGQGNAPVQLVVRHLRLSRPPQRLGKDQQHWKLWVTEAGRTGGVPVEVVWWGAGEAPAPSAPVFDLAVVPEINDYNGVRRLQLKMLDWRPVADPAGA